MFWKFLDGRASSLWRGVSVFRSQVVGGYAAAGSPYEPDCYRSGFRLLADYTKKEACCPALPRFGTPASCSTTTSHFFLCGWFVQNLETLLFHVPASLPWDWRFFVVFSPLAALFLHQTSLCGSLVDEKDDGGGVYTSRAISPQIPSSLHPDCVFGGCATGFGGRSTCVQILALLGGGTITTE